LAGGIPEVVLDGQIELMFLLGIAMLFGKLGAIFLREDLGARLTPNIPAQVQGEKFSS